MNTQQLRTTWHLAILVLLSSLLAGCGINNIPTYDEQVSLPGRKLRISISVAPT